MEKPQRPFLNTLGAGVFFPNCNESRWDGKPPFVRQGWGHDLQSHCKDEGFGDGSAEEGTI
eukprot:5272263-Amphidinium_carterae.1